QYPPADGRQTCAAGRADGIGAVEGILDAEPMVVAPLGGGGGGPAQGRPGGARLRLSHGGSHAPFVTYLGEIGKLSGHETMQAALAEDMDTRALSEQPRDGGVAHIEPAGIGAEGGQDQAP